MRVTPAIALFLTLVAFFAGCSKQETSPPPEAVLAPATPPSPPEVVLETFFLALSESNGDLAFECTTGDTFSREFVDSQVRLNDAFALFGKNAVDRFPEEGKRLQAPPPALLAIKTIEEVPVTVSGTTATWPSTPAAPMKLLLVNGEWKMDLANSFPNTESLRMAILTFDGIAEYLEDIATEVAEGKYGTVKEVQQELKRRGETMGQEHSR